jgi:hypothetical protein
VKEIRDFRARLAHIKENRRINGLGEPPSSDTVNHVGHRFHETEFSQSPVDERDDMKEVRPASTSRARNDNVLAVNVTAMLKLSWMLY